MKKTFQLVLLFEHFLFYFHLKHFDFHECTKLPKIRNETVEGFVTLGHLFSIFSFFLHTSMLMSSFETGAMKRKSSNIFYDFLFKIHGISVLSFELSTKNKQLRISKHVEISILVGKIY